MNMFNINSEEKVFQVMAFSRNEFLKKPYLKQTNKQTIPHLQKNRKQKQKNKTENKTKKNPAAFC